MSQYRAYEALISFLQTQDYAFVCPSPEAQARVIERRTKSRGTVGSLSDVFGWNLPMESALPNLLPADLIQQLIEAGVVSKIHDNSYHANIRVSEFYLPQISHADAAATKRYYIHSSFPVNSDSVFFGPDTYLFLELLRQSSYRDYLGREPRSIIDVCCGAGAGAIHMARDLPKASVMGIDLNEEALELGAINATLQGVDVSFIESNLYENIPESCKHEGVDVIISNPPYIASDGQNVAVYADGGGQEGLELSLKILREGQSILSSNGIIILYTGVAIGVENPGFDPLLDKLKAMDGLELMEYRIIQPSMWDEEIGKGSYTHVGRIQVVGAVLQKGR